MVEDNYEKILRKLSRNNVDKESKKTFKDINNLYGHLFGETVVFNGRNYIITGLKTETIYDFPKYDYELDESKSVHEIVVENEIKVSFELKSSFIDIINLDAKDIIEYFVWKESGTNENK